MISSLYLRIAMYAVIAAVPFGAGWSINGDRWTAKYDTLIAQDATASEKARRDADTANAAIATAYQDKLAVTEKTYEAQHAIGRANADTLARRLSNYAHTNCRSPLSTSPAAPGGSDGAPAVPGGVAGADDVVRRAIEACSADAAQLQALEAERASLNKAK
jgi:hypothetical protein